MNCSLASEPLTLYVAKQLRTFFPDGVTLRALVQEIRISLPEALGRLATAVAGIKPPLFHREGAPFFNHLHSDQYAMFLYLLAHEAGCRLRSTEIATKLYLLNKALHGLDVFYEVRLPQVFLFAHPVGTVLGRATYGERFMVMQGCTVGNVRSTYPALGAGVVLCSGSSVLGGAVLGEGVTVGAGALVVGAKLAANSTVIGRGKELVATVSSQPPMWQQYFHA